MLFQQYFYEIIFMFICFAVDCLLFVKLKKSSFKASIIIFAFWSVIAVLFCIFIYIDHSKTHAIEFITGYTIERTLGLDNIFVFFVIFNSFKVPDKAREIILFWGIILAIILRFLFIYLGAILIEKFQFMMYIFGAFLLFTGIKLLFASEDNHKESFIQKIFFKLPRTTATFANETFLTKINGKVFLTSMAMVMSVIAFTDIIFALDSIPAIFGITKDPFIVLTANFFSLMGLRAMFCLINYIMVYFYYIKYALSGILVFIGTKMLIAGFFHVPTLYSIAFIFAAILLAVLFSIIRAKNLNHNAT